MQYMGGKAKIAKRLVAFLNQHRKPGQIYVEPFLGGCNILPLLENPRLGADTNEDVIMCYRDVRDGWAPPEHVSEEEYRELQYAPVSALRGFAGIACSFAGKWFGGYARRKAGDATAANFSGIGRRWALKVAPKLQGARLVHASYDELDIPDGSLVYCDPPYAGTTKYKCGAFDHEHFWQWVRQLSARCTVFVSEYQAPADFECVWELARDFGMSRQHKGGDKQRVERLFKHKGH